jgi:hypothetical protein
MIKLTWLDCFTASAIAKLRAQPNSWPQARRDCLSVGSVGLNKLVVIFSLAADFIGRGL